MLAAIGRKSPPSYSIIWYKLSSTLLTEPAGADSAEVICGMAFSL
jgi:hypothetical protein